MIISRLALFAINLNDLGWSSEMARWKAASKGFPTSYLRRPTEVIDANREQRKEGVEVAPPGKKYGSGGNPACKNGELK